MTAKSPVDDQVRRVVAQLERRGSRKGREGMARYGLPSDRAFGVAMSAIQAVAGPRGRSHALADALWKTGWYEAPLRAAFVDEPERVTSARMDRWCRGNRALHAAAVTVAKRLAESPQAAPRWIGKDALRELTSAAVLGRLARSSTR